MLYATEDAEQCRAAEVRGVGNGSLSRAEQSSYGGVYEVLCTALHVKHLFGAGLPC
jgi:hypothetical protein